MTPATIDLVPLPTTSTRFGDIKRSGHRPASLWLDSPTLADPALEAAKTKPAPPTVASPPPPHNEEPTFRHPANPPDHNTLRPQSSSHRPDKFHRTCGDNPTTRSGPAVTFDTISPPRGRQQDPTGRASRSGSPGRSTSQQQDRTAIVRRTRRKASPSRLRPTGRAKR